MPITFKFRLVPFIAAIVAVAIGISLGNWQLGRANHKEALQATIDQRQKAPPIDLNNTQSLTAGQEGEFHQVVARGEFIKDWTIFLDNRPNKGVSGFYVITPLKLEGSDQYVLVARGWHPRDPRDRQRLPSVPTPEGQIEVRGVLRQSAARVLQLGEESKIVPGAIVQNLNLEKFAQASQMPLFPLIIEQTNPMPDNLERDWPQPTTGVDKHLGYAFQWYGLAATAFIFFVVTGIRRGARQTKN